MTLELETDPTAPSQSQRIVVRASRDEDVDAMLAIYLHHVRKGLDPKDAPLYEAPQKEDLKRRRKNMGKHRLPHLVAELERTVIGYAYAVPFRKRPAYRYVVKHSIYVDPSHLHRGVGRLLLPALIDACAAAGFRQMIGYIDASNTPSLKLHEACGFAQVGYLSSVGFKYGRWTDSIIMQRSLGPGATTLPGGRD
ncbi:GNAT family N-acetyltransferase [Methylocystis parvus]|uniref:N-acetyltransferase family protein n=1 Tax=Methylocystis parvus TaxID=134 RepID=A0A6B8M7Z0_9HYPH|nr:GNAT family N-acetyltransferase [Methylocystis parvus]QGM97749.1 N-acetyltransferase family protein [Methylocystis parvus]WBK01947.1 GNAT family N-acetyltransferase [Methylocystis parvus OBBP]